jgi:oligopeptide/dipeptide ABC transporter ATP-binding protein
LETDWATYSTLQMKTDNGHIVLQVADLRVRLGKAKHEVVRGVDLEAPSGHMVGLVGESGSGKSMTLRAISRLMPRGIPYQLTGTINLDGQALLRAGDKEMRAIRAQQIGFVFQEPLSSLNPGFTIGWQAREALSYMRDGGLPRKTANALIDETLESVGLPNGSRIRSGYPFEMSGGMRQRILIAIALLRNPSILLADEPITALDVSIGAEILDLLQELKESRSLTTILVSHDLSVVAQRCDDVAVMYMGRIVERGPASSLFQSARHPYTQGLLQASVDVFGGAPERLSAIPGEPLLTAPLVGCAFASRCPFAIERCHQETPELSPADESRLHSVACHRAGEGVEIVSVDEAPAISMNSERVPPKQRAGAGAEAIINVENLTVTYPIGAGRGDSREERLTAVDRLSLAIPAGQVVGIGGESGSGKSTLGRAIAGLQRVDSGTIRVNGITVDQNPAKNEIELRRTVQFVFQDPASSLNPRMRVRTILDRALRLRPGVGRKQREFVRAELLESVGLNPRLGNRYPRELSGGQRQRVAIAVALAPEPQVLVADEPTSALDVSIQAQILELLRTLVQERQMTLVLITHDFGAIRAIADTAAVMHLGEIVEYASVDDIIHGPLQPYTRALVASVPSWQRTRSPSERLIGPPLSPLFRPDGCRLQPRCPYARPDCETTPQELEEVATDHSVRCMYAVRDSAQWETPESIRG